MNKWLTFSYLHYSYPNLNPNVVCRSNNGISKGIRLEQLLCTRNNSASPVGVDSEMHEVEVSR